MPSPDTSYGSMQSSPYYQPGQLTPSGASTTARSMATYTISPPGTNAAMGFPGNGGSRPDYGAYATGLSARGKVNAYGQQGTEQLWIAEQNRPRPMGPAGGLVAPGYSPRQSIQRAQMSLGMQPPPQQQARAGMQQHQLGQQGQSLLDRSPRSQQLQHASPQQQHQQMPSQYVPSPQMYMPGRGFGNGVRSLQQQQQQLPPQPPMLQQNGQFGSNNSAYPQRGAPAPTSLYARQGPSSLNHSPHNSPPGQSQVREMEAPRYSQHGNGNGLTTGAAGAGSSALHQGGGGSLYQQHSVLAHSGLGDEGAHFNAFRDMDLGLNLSEFPNADNLLSLNAPREAASASSNLSGGSFSGSSSRSSGAVPQSLDQEQWY